jgi:phosphotransferase family enzyme
VQETAAEMGRAPDTLRPLVEALLHNRFGGTVRLDSGVMFDPGARSQVYRFTILDGPGGLPATVIAKQATGRGGKTYAPDDPTGPACGLFNDWAGLQFLDALGGDRPPAARFYGGDRAAGVLVLEDMGDGAHLHTFVLGRDPAAAEAALIGLATTLGRMHALAAGKTGEYRRLRAALGPANPAAMLDGYDWLAPAFDGMVVAFGITPARGTAADLAVLHAALRDPGPFLTYLHGDPCLDNCLLTPAGVRLFDFEVGGAGQALTDGVYGRMRFPSCWCVGQLPAAIPLRMEAAYRAQLVRGCPAAADDRLFYHAVAEACAFWILRMGQAQQLTRALESDYEWGIATGRQRFLLRLPMVSRLLQEMGHLEALGASFGMMAAQGARLWPDLDPMLPYPAFQSGAPS